MKYVYLNANLVFSDIVPRVMKKWDNKPQGTLFKLSLDFKLVTSVLTRLEVMQNLSKRFNFSTQKSRTLYMNVLKRYNINEIQDVNKHFHLNSAFCDSVAKTSLELKDAMHIAICKDMNFILCTHDTKMRRHHTLKKMFYDNIFKPEELINSNERTKNA